LCYLYDLACLQATGKACTDLRYIWHLHGPYCDDFERANFELQDAGKMKIEHVVTEKYDCNLHSATTTRPPKLGEVEDGLLDIVVNRFGSMPMKKLEEFVYSTPPMLKAQKNRVRFQPLDMREKGNFPGGFFDRKAVIAIVQSNHTPRANFVSWDKVLTKLKTIPAQTV
jgi:hypothetical protein